MDLSINRLLADSCSVPAVDFDPKKSYEEMLAETDGYSVYVIGLHCVEYSIVAKRITPGIYDEAAGDWQTLPDFHVKSYTTRSV